MVLIVCTDPLHASRSAAPGWRASLGTVSDGQAAPDGMRCDACAVAMATSATLNPAGALNGIQIRKDGLVTITEWFYYPDGTPARPVNASATVAQLVAAGVITPADVSSVQAVFAKIRAAAVNQLT